MKTVCDINKCAGCKACLEVCNKNAINIVDTLKANNAFINENKCVNCGACHKVCQENNNYKFEGPMEWKQGWASNENLRSTSSSGGIAAELMNSFISNGGIVCTCAFLKGKFGFTFIDNVSDIKKVIGSKYVKSDPLNVYKELRNKIRNNTKVLFIGLPCQVAAIKLYIGENYDENLFTIDLICHGTPSPKLLDMFLMDYKLNLNTITNIQFRKKNKFSIFNDYKPIVHEKIQDNYMHAFLNCLDYTDNCYECKYARKERVGDITLGDSWGSELPSDEINKGISIIIVSTVKGKKILSDSNVILSDVDENTAIKHNRQLRQPSKAPESRELFFKHINKTKSFRKAIAKCSPKFYYKQKIKEILIKMKILG